MFGGACVYSLVASTSVVLTTLMVVVAFGLAGIALAAKLEKIKLPLASVSVWLVIVPAVAGALSLFFGVSMAQARREDAERRRNEERIASERVLAARAEATTAAARLRERAPSIIQEARAKLSSAQSLLTQTQVRPAVAAIAEGRALVQPLIALSPVPAGAEELRASFASLDTQAQPLLAFQTALDQLQSTLETGEGTDVIAFDVAIERGVSVIDSTPEVVRSRFASTSALVARAAATRRTIRRRVASAQAARAAQAALMERCGPAPELGPWDNEIIGSEAFVRRGAHDPGSIDVEDCTPPQLTRNCWVSTCTVRGTNAFGALVANEMEFTVMHRQVISARRR